MVKKFLFILTLSLFIISLCLQNSFGKINLKLPALKISFVADSVPPSEVMDVIAIVIASTEKFNIESVANLYTPNAIIADDEPPYSWNGPTAGVQWVNAVEKACKDSKITKLKGSIGVINIFQQNGDNIYLIVPVNYTGNYPGKRRFTSNGAFNFVLRLTNGKWIIKSQTWINKKGYSN